VTPEELDKLKLLLLGMVHLGPEADGACNHFARYYGLRLVREIERLRAEVARLKGVTP
jgi:hypothetical protein